MTRTRGFLAVLYRVQVDTPRDCRRGQIIGYLLLNCMSLPRPIPLPPSPLPILTPPCFPPPFSSPVSPFLTHPNPNRARPNNPHSNRRRRHHRHHHARPLLLLPQVPPHLKQAPIRNARRFPPSRPPPTPRPGGCPISRPSSARRCATTRPCP